MVTVLAIMAPICIITAIVEGCGNLKEWYLEHRRMTVYARR